MHKIGNRWAGGSGWVCCSDWFRTHFGRFFDIFGGIPAAESGGPTPAVRPKPGTGNCGDTAEQARACRPELLHSPTTAKLHFHVTPRNRNKVQSLLATSFHFFNRVRKSLAFLQPELAAKRNGGIKPAPAKSHKIAFQVRRLGRGSPSFQPPIAQWVEARIQSFLTSRLARAFETQGALTANQAGYTPHYTTLRMRILPMLASPPLHARAVHRSGSGTG